MDMELLYSLTLLIAYSILRVFSWHEAMKETKSAFWTRSLIQDGTKENQMVKSTYWTRALIQTNLKNE